MGAQNRHEQAQDLEGNGMELAKTQNRDESKTPRTSESENVILFFFPSNFFKGSFGSTMTNILIKWGRYLDIVWKL